MEKRSTKIFIFIIIIIGFITTFTSGFFLSTLLSTENKPPTVSSVTPSITPFQIPVTTDAPGITQDSTKFLPGKHYFDDDIILITKDKPRISLVASVVRSEQDSGYIQNTRVSYFDGSSWTRQTDYNTIPDPSIISGKLVNNWKIDIDPSRVLKQTVQGKITVKNTVINFSTGVLENEIGIRSLPGYTKFTSNGTGKLDINGTPHDTFILYTRIYSLNAADIQFYDKIYGLTTDWIAFWDSAGNFYHVDSTNVGKPTSIYQTHQLGIMENAAGSVSKSFVVSVNRDTQNPPDKYIVTINNPIDSILNFKRINGIDKAPNSGYTWYMGNIEGTVRTKNGENLPGFGLVEYIHG